ncbi:MAG TPA: acyltransferase [Verrucomicrobiae bacterium]|nr:acyltransferase [Verrucomicrobiae bacterium]
MTSPAQNSSLAARVRKRLHWIWVNFWLRRAGWSRFGRLAGRLAALGYPPYKGRLELANIQPKGYVSPNATIRHDDLRLGNHTFIGERVVIYQHERGGPVELGDRTLLFDETIIEILEGGALRVGAGTTVQPRCHFTSAVAPIVIGKGVQIAPRCAFYSYDHGLRADQLIYAQPLQSKGPIVIEDDAWLGFGVIVLSGVRIGKGAVIGAGSVVTEDISDNAVAVGTPARVVKMRTDPVKTERTQFQRAAG